MKLFFVYMFFQLMLLKDKKEAPGIEICPTSNLITLGLKSYAEHPFLRDWLKLQYPISINTDDRGIFNTTLTKELLYVKDAIGLDLADMVQILGMNTVLYFLQCRDLEGQGGFTDYVVLHSVTWCMFLFLFLSL